MARVAVLGTGAMGSRMAASLIGAGHSVCVWNRTLGKARTLVDQGAFAASSPARAAEVSDYVIAMVRDDEASRQVWLDPDKGALAAMRPDAAAIESSTLSVAWSAELAGRFGAANKAFIDAPVVGSRPQAEARALIFLAGGEASVVERCNPLLLDMGAQIHHAGAAGSGTLLKLMVNGLFGVQVAAFAEMIGMLERQGLEAQRALDIIVSTPVCSPAALMAATAMLAGNFAPAFPTEIVEKDFGYIAAAANAAPMAAAARAVFSTAIERGLGDENLTSIVKLYRGSRPEGVQ